VDLAIHTVAGIVSEFPDPHLPALSTFFRRWAGVGTATSRPLRGMIFHGDGCGFLRHGKADAFCPAGGGRYQDGGCLGVTVKGGRQRISSLLVEQVRRTGLIPA